MRSDGGDHRGGHRARVLQKRRTKTMFLGSLTEEETRREGIRGSTLHSRCDEGKGERTGLANERTIRCSLPVLREKIVLVN